MADIFREVDEELRRDRMVAMWRKYGSYLIAAAVLVVVVTAAVIFWRQHRHEQREADATAYVEARRQAAAGETQRAVASFATLAAEASAPYDGLARFEQARLLSEQGDRAGAVAALEAAVGDGGLSPALRDLAVLSIGYQLLDTADREALFARVGPLAAEGNPWRHQARELLGLAAMRAGDAAAAREQFTTLSEDPQTPASLRGRASEYLAVLDGG